MSDQTSPKSSSDDFDPWSITAIMQYQTLPVEQRLAVLEGAYARMVGLVIHCFVNREDEPNRDTADSTLRIGEMYLHHNPALMTYLKVVGAELKIDDQSNPVDAQAAREILEDIIARPDAPEYAIERAHELLADLETEDE